MSLPPSDASPSGFDGGQTPASAHQVEAFVFSGRGSEYFRIWIVNLLLSIITLGIYSAWAKVRRTRYFYDNTTINGSSFEYHGNPIAILKGRIIAVILIGGYQIAFKFSLGLGVLALALMLAGMPWLIWKSYQFKLYNSSYRGIRFGFRGSAGRSYFNYLLLPLLAGITLWLALPFAHQRIKKYLHQESKFGATHFSFDASVGSFYKTYLIGAGVALLGYIAIMITFSSTLAALGAGLQHGGAAVISSAGLLFLSLYAWTFLIMPLFLTMIQNLIWNHTKLGQHQFQSQLKWSKTAFIMITNLIGIVITLGLFAPFAHVRWFKYRIESVTLLAAGSLDNFVADEEAQGSVAGEGISDLLDFDLSL
ncbi:YjgN family protein [Collimonas sp.]|uniref:YjgN family protein n=1 Tax=Collimonas sp. TaxID=1963772 RepID=UPI002BCDC1B6|nr:YjgN family protein [Collimonas sp.]HWW07971.1 YjgN family protein [Collimonas sp.]